MYNRSINKVYLSILFCSAPFSIMTMEKVINSSVEFDESKPDFTLVNTLVGFLKGQEPKLSPKQSVLSYPNQLNERKKEFVLMRVDGQDGRTRITGTAKYPYSSFCHLNTVFEGLHYGGSGVLVGPHHILTAAHCVYDYEKSQWAEQCTAYCGLSGDIAPFGRCEVVRIYVPEEYIRTQSIEFDIALLVLDCPIGLRVGYLGCLYSSDIKMFDEGVHITGYPGDKGQKEMWTMSNKVKAIGAERINYDIDTYYGQSGSPIWSTFNLDDKNQVAQKRFPLVVGIHTHGEGSAGEGNSGIRLTEYKFRLIIDWMTKTGKLLEKLIKSPVLANPAAADASLNSNNDKFNTQPQPNQGAANYSDNALLLATVLGLKINELDGNGLSILHKAINDGNKALVEMLIAKGADVHLQDFSGRSPVYIAAEKNHIEIVEILLKSGADATTADKKGLTPLHVSSSGKIVTLLVVMGGEVNAATALKSTPLHVAVKRDNIEVALILLQNHANPNLADEEPNPNAYDTWKKANDPCGYTPLHLAALKGNKKMVELLLNWGASSDVGDFHNLSPVYLAVSKGFAEIVDLLLQKVTIRSRYTINYGYSYIGIGRTLLHLAAKRGDTVIVNLLLDHGADIQAVEKCGETPLHEAARAGSKEVVELLVNRGADERVANCDGRTILHHAVESGREALVEFLIEKKLDVNATDKEGRTPLFIAEERMKIKETSSLYEAIISLLLKNGAKKEIGKKKQ